jgi:hypothetical protein
VKEKELEPPVERFLRAQGYRTYCDPDGTGYFDVIAVRDEPASVGLVELKIADWRRVFDQALLRRGWGDWVAVVLPKRTLAQRALQRRAPPLVRSVGVWVVEGAGEVRVLREAAPLSSLPGAEAFDPLRAHLRESLRMLDSGLLPPGTSWRIVRPHRRSGRPGSPLHPGHWRIEELVPPQEEGEPRPSGTDPA